MVVSKEALARIRKIVHKHYSSLLVTLLGNSVFTEQEKEELQAMGVDLSNPNSLLELIYLHNILNAPDSKMAPMSVSEMKKQQQDAPHTKLQPEAIEHLNHNFRNIFEDFKSEVASKLEGIIRNENNNFRNRQLNETELRPHINKLIQESTVGQIKQQLRDYSGDSNRNWQRVAITEVSNAIGIGSVDRVISQNPDKHPKELLVFRIPIEDAALCRHCRRFYLDGDGTPAVYRLSTLIGNGTNYGKKVAEWEPVAVATHPNERCSGMVELKPGWKVVSGGKLEYIGLEKWNSYISEKIRN